MVKRLQLSFLLILLAVSVSAQKKDKMLYGVIIDENETRINDVCVSDVNGTLLAMTDSDGVFEIPLMQKIDLTLSHPRFEKSTVPVNPEDFEAIHDKYYTIFMLSDKNDSIVRQDTLTQKEYVVDYKVGKYGIFMIKTDGTHSTLNQLSFRNKIIASLSIETKFNRLFLDALDGIHIFSNDSSYQVFSDGENLTLAEGLNIEYFKSSIMSLVAVTDSVAISCIKYYHNQSINYIMTNLNTAKASLLCNIDSEAVKHPRDNEIVTLLRLMDYHPNWSFWYRNPNLNTHWVNKISYKELLSSRQVYAPLINIGNMFYIFDFPDGFLCKYRDDGTFIGNIEIIFHLTHGYATKFHDNPWDNNIIFDAAKKECYAQYKENGKITLKKISLSNGDVVSSYTIERHDNPHNIQIHNGVVYYLYFENGVNEYEKRYFFAEMIK